MVDIQLGRPNRPQVYTKLHRDVLLGLVRSQKFQFCIITCFPIALPQPARTLDTNYTQNKSVQRSIDLRILFTQKSCPFHFYYRSNHPSTQLQVHICTHLSLLPPVNPNQPPHPIHTIPLPHNTHLHLRILPTHSPKNMSKPLIDIHPGLNSTFLSQHPLINQSIVP